MVAAIYGWFIFLNQKAKNRPSKRKVAVEQDL
jgi:hypothetical protein